MKTRVYLKYSMIVDLHHSKFINHSYDLSLTTVILLTTKNIIHFLSKIINVSNNAALTMTGNQNYIQRNTLSRIRLGLFPLRRWYRKFSCFYKVLQRNSLKFYFNTIPISSSSYITRNTHNIPEIRVKHNFFKDTFFPSTTRMEQNLIMIFILIFISFTIFKSKFLKFNRPGPNSVFN